MNITWHKDAKPSTYYATLNGKRIATARKEGGAWIGSVVGLGFTFGGRRLVDVKELALVHVERIYGEGEWTLFPARDLKPGMILGCDTWKGGEREIVSVDVDKDAQTVSVELASESARELGFTLDDTYAVDQMVRVKVEREELSETEPAPAEACSLCGGQEGTLFPVESEDGTPERAHWRCLSAPAVEESEPVRVEAPAVELASAVEICGKRRTGWERPGPGRHRLPCIRSAGHAGLHRDALLVEWLDAEAGMQTINLRPFTAIVDVIAGTGVLVSPPASEDLTLSEGGASLHDSLRADALRRLLPHGIEALEGEDGGLSLEGVTDDGRKVFSLYVSDCITTEPDFEEVAVSIEALRQAAGL
ncbi:hypothetical protein ACIODZ_31525 [[Kitasatospora] papulosa]|uniref:hypothetical protein n=1 Tax=[Kitasatospora] papulosa TaxID=1464011 RepID=UPI0038132700